MGVLVRRGCCSNEDFAATGTNVAVLLDGAAVPAGMHTGRRHGVQWYVRQLADHLLTQAAIPGLPLQEALAAAIQEVTNGHRRTCEVAHPRSPSSAVVVARWNDAALEWLVLGDCVLLMDGRAGLAAISDRRLDAVRPRHSEQSAGRSPLTRLDDERSMRNREGGYWIAANDPEAARHALTGCSRLTGAQQLSSQPMEQRARPIGSACTTGTTFSSWTSHWPAGWLTRLREVEASDPEKKRWPRNETHQSTLAVLRPQAQQISRLHR